MSDLKMYKVEDGETHYVIAESAEDAGAVLVECGLVVDPKTVEDYGATFTLLAMTAPLTRGDEDGRGKTTHKVAEWIASEGRGLFASSVF